MCALPTETRRNDRSCNSNRNIDPADTGNNATSRSTAPSRQEPSDSLLSMVSLGDASLFRGHSNTIPADLDIFNPTNVEPSYGHFVPYLSSPRLTNRVESLVAIIDRALNTISSEDLPPTNEDDENANNAHLVPPFRKQ